MNMRTPFSILRTVATAGVLVGWLFSQATMAADTDAAASSATAATSGVAAASSSPAAASGTVTYSSWKAAGGVETGKQDTTNNSAIYVGEKVCKTCHEAENKNFGHTLHAKIFRENPRNDVEKAVCEACHGPGSKHVKRQTIKLRLSVTPKNGVLP